MAKYYGAIGYNRTEEVRPGVYKETVTERKYSGDVIQAFRRTETGDGVNDNLNVNVRISIVADPFANENFYSIVYAEWMGAKWKVTSVEPQYPRLILSVGGLYNGQSR